MIGHPEPADRTVAENAVESAHVVGIAVRGDEQVDPPDVMASERFDQHQTGRGRRR